MPRSALDSNLVGPLCGLRADVQVRGRVRAGVESNDVSKWVAKDRDAGRRRAHHALLVRIPPARRRVASAVVERMIGNEVGTTDARFIDAAVGIQRIGSPRRLSGLSRGRLDWLMSGTATGQHDRDDRSIEPSLDELALPHWSAVHPYDARGCRKGCAPRDDSATAERTLLLPWARVPLSSLTMPLVILVGVRDERASAGSTFSWGSVL